APSAQSSWSPRRPPASTKPGGGDERISAGALPALERLTQGKESSMRTGIVWLLSGVAVLCGGHCAWAQAGRFVPRPRFSPGGGGGRGFHIPHIPLHPFGQDSDAGQGSDVGPNSVVGGVIGLIFLAIFAVIILVRVGYHLGWVLGGGSKRSKEWGRGRQARSSANSWQREGTSAPLDVGMSWPATGS